MAFGVNKAARRWREHPGKRPRRAAVACLPCRGRKVHCDVTPQGRACSNCRRRNEKCAVPARVSNQDRDGAAHIVQVSHPPHTVDAGCQTEAGELSTSSPTNYSAPTLHKLADSGAPTWGANRASARIHDLPGIAWQHLFPPGDGQATTTPSEAGESSPGSGISATSPTRNAFAYRFLSVNNLNSMSSQDINFLESQGCFLVPARHVLDEFVEQYFLHSHPLLPFLNEGDFWDMYSEDSEETMPLLVFYSMLFSSCNFVSQSSIVALGFPSIRAARASLYRRAKLLYDLETELSPVHLSQAALLLTYWSPSDSSRLKRPNSTWLSMAIQNARAAQGPKYATMQTISKTANVKHHKRQASLKRLWWCCIIRDRILPLVVRRPLQITRSDFDFDKNLGLIYEDLQDYVERSSVYNPTVKHQLVGISSMSSNCAQS